MTSIVVSQPMYFPWVGFFEQIQLSDIFVCFDNVQFSKGFVNRVQCKTPSGFSWLTIPLVKHPRSTLICDLQISENNDWRKKHIAIIENFLGNTKFKNDAIEIVEKVIYTSAAFSDMLMEGIKTVTDYFEIDSGVTQFHRSSELDVTGKKSELVKNIASYFNADTYITGLGALNYLDHESLEKNGIETRYMKYERLVYPQKYGKFNPYISILDLIANCGKDGRKFICSGTVNWKNINREIYG
ncbi:MAG: WbqC family protein [Desulfobacula sp.]|nr:WbqC family protein [Desulfobacula sp.]